MYRTEEYSKGFITGGTLFEELGFFYLGPIDGHNFNDLISAFETSKKMGELNCILAKTIKGKGCKLMENKKDWHYWNAMSDAEIEKTRKELA